MVSSQPIAEEHHLTLYFDDGNVVLSCLRRNGRSRIYFRVHRSILSRHSPVLAEMFAIPPLLEDFEDPSKGLKETYDGVVHIQAPDSAEDVESFLGVLYDPL